LLAAAAVAAVAVAGCSSGGGNSSGNNGNSGGKKGGTLVFGESTALPENYMPIIAAGNSTANADVLARTLDGAFRITPQIAFEKDPDQITDATSEIKNGQQVITFKINPKAVWADGEPITADDYLFTWQTEKSADPKDGGCPALLSTTGFDQIESGKAIDQHTVEFTFKKDAPYPDWQGLFASTSGIMLSKHVFDQGDPAKTCDYITKGWPAADGVPLGAQNGPWLLKKENINTGAKTVTLVPNPKYWGEKPKLDRLVIAYIGSESDTNLKALSNKEVNMIYPQPQLDLVGNLKKLSGVTTEINFGVAFEHLDFNTADPLLAHKEVRQAIAYAIDRPALVQATVGQFSDKASVLGNRLLMANQTGYEDHSDGYAKQDIAKAKQLLESIGAKMGGDGIYTLDGKPLAFKVSTTQNNPLRDQTITTIAQQVKAAGIKLTEFADPDIFAGKEKPTSLEAEGFQIALFAWVGGPSLSSNRSIYYTKAKGGGQNYSQGATPEIDAALDAMATSANTQDAIKNANKADELLWGQMYTLPLYQKPTLLAFDSNYTGIGDNATQAGPLWNSDSFALTS
jgi:peptide/nickel transport system substrate-binding protein